jgi:succinoglycan biosynthesis transport protein ExoP
MEAERRNQKALYDQLLSRQGQSEVSKQIEVQDKTTTYRIVEPAIISVKPVKPNRLKLMLLGFIAGIAGGFGLIFGLDFVDKSIKSVDTVKSLGLQILAVVPLIPDVDNDMKLQKRNRVLTVVASCYLSLILLVIAMEVVGLPYMDKFFSKFTSGS